MRVVAGIAVLLVMLSSTPGVVSTITSLSGSGITKPHFRAIQCHTTPPSVQSTIGFGATAQTKAPTDGGATHGEAGDGTTARALLRTRRAQGDYCGLRAPGRTDRASVDFSKNMTDRLGRLLLATLEAARVDADMPALGPSARG
jgi:hypothetical protein